MSVLRDDTYGQYRLPLEGPAAPPDEKNAREIAWHFFESAKKNYDRVGRLITAELEGLGHTVFDVQTENDRHSVETDFGAPAIGLDFFAELFTPTRAFRYTPTRTIEGAVRTHHLQAMAVGEYLHKRGYKIFNKNIGEALASQVLFMNGGVTRAFSDTIKFLLAEQARTNEERNKVGRAQKGAVLVPVPTYGLFLYMLEELLEKNPDVQLIKIRRRDNGAVEPLSLESALGHCRLNNIRPLAYYDCNPHNPTGHIRDEAETRAIAKIIMDDSLARIEEEIQFYHAITKNKESSPEIVKIADAFLIQIEKPQNLTVMIDDMAYEDLHYVNKKPFSFAQVSKEAAAHTVTLKGVSKIGLPGARIALMIGHHEILSHMFDQQLVHEFTASTLGVDIITARYSNAGNHQHKFAAHYKKLQRAHRQKLGYIEAIVNGLDATNKITRSQKRDFVAAYAGRFNTGPRLARKILEKGLPNFTLPQHEVESGFFVNIGMQSLQDKIIAMRFDGNPHPLVYKIDSSSTLYYAFRAFGVKIVSSAGQGNDEGSLQGRVTISVKEDQLLDFANRMHAMHDYFFGKKPQGQLDFFRKNPAAFRGIKITSPNL